MTTRTIDLSGSYIVASVSATELVLTSPEDINPGWHYVDLNGSGSTGYAQNISMVTPPAFTVVDLSGTYIVASVTPTEVTLTNPELTKSDWGMLGIFSGAKTKLLSSFVSTNASNWIGPFIVEPADTALLVANFVAMQGLYKQNDKKQTAFPITIEIEATPVNTANAAIGAPQTFSVVIPGNSSGRDMRAATLVCELAQPGRQSVRARRATYADYIFKGTVVDEVKWKDLYGVSSVDLAHFGDVTTVHSRTYATEGALNVKERKLNMLVTRKVPNRIAGTSFTSPIGTTHAGDIFTAICRDPYIGGRPLADLDLNSIYGAVADAIAYFGHNDAGKFSFTFDDDNLSFEETAAIVAQAVLCTAFRQASLLRMALERATNDGELLFNHRNKLPGSEKRTIRFGNLDANDGIELEYVDPDDDSVTTLYLPADRSATHPRSIKAIGVRSHVQAYWQAWRLWNRIRYQNVAVEFTALSEAALVVRNSRVLIADNTRPDTQDGDVLSQAGLQLEVSQPVAFVPGVAYTMFIQLPDGTLDSIPVTPGSDSHHVVIGRAPRLALIIGEDQYALPTYQIVRNDSPRPNAFLISEREPEGNFTFTVRAINYSPLYYMNDHLAVWLDFENGYQDAGPSVRDTAAVAGSGIVTDGTRGKVHQGTGQMLPLPAFNAPASYTKAFWARRNNLADTTTIFGSTGAHEFVALGGGAVIRVNHGGGELLQTAWPGAAGEWHHVAVAYDATDGELAIYVDGALAASVSSVARGTLGPLNAVGWNGGFGHAGAIDDLRLMTRALEPAEVRALFRATRL
jgi:hypothetical protein